MDPSGKPTETSFCSVADVYLTLLREGRAPSIEEFAVRFPHLQEQLLKELPAIAMIQECLGDIQPDEATSVGNQLGSCEIDCQIGRGGMGTVYRAHQPELGRVVAVKVLVLDGTDPGMVERFKLERHAMARLDHPNIVPVYEYGHTPQVAYLVMKYIPGCNLRSMIDEQPDYEASKRLAELHGNWGMLARIGADVASGLQHAHDQGLIHRDIKPSNLLLDEDWKVWIADFGLAKLTDYAHRISKTGLAIGTFRYMAPEQVMGVSDVRCDVYSLGRTLYELATGQLISESSAIPASAGQRATQGLTDVREVNPQIPPALARIIMKACALDPEDRYQTAEEFEFVLRRFANGHQNAERRRPTRPSDEVYRKRKRRAQIASVIALALAILAAVEWYSDVKSNRAASQMAAEWEGRLDTDRTQQAHYLASTELQANLLDRLAESEDKQVVDVVADYVKETVDHAAGDTRTSRAEREKLKQNVDKIAEKVSGQISNDNALNAIMHRYRESSLAVGNKIARIRAVIARSGLNAAEKQDAVKTIDLFAVLTIREAIDTVEASQIVDQLTHGRSYTADEIYTFVATDRSLRRWLAVVEAMVSDREVHRDEVGRSILEEVNKVLSDAAAGDLRQMSGDRRR